MCIRDSLESGAPVLFRQGRIGLNGRHFEILKFRSMRNEPVPKAASWTSDSDPRITPVSYTHLVSPGTTYYNAEVGAFDALDFLTLCQEGSLVAYGGGAADRFNDRYFLWTSGHNNYQGNEMYEFNFSGPSLTVSRITGPTWTVDNTDVPPNCA